MEIEITEKNTGILLDGLLKTIQEIKNLSASVNPKESEKKRLTMLDLLCRQFPNLNTIHLLLNQYFTERNLGNTLPIGLIMRCSLEDMMHARYLISFQDVPEIFENEIVVQSKNAISEYLQFIVENESEYWMLPEEEKEKFKTKAIEQYNLFKSENPIFFDEQGKVKPPKKLRRDIPNIRDFFDSSSIERQGPSTMFNRIKSVDLSFSYIYFEYKFYCLFEHYSFYTRNVTELNKFTFAQLALSFEFVLSGIIHIVEYLALDPKHMTEFKNIKLTLGDLLKEEIAST